MSWVAYSKLLIPSLLPDSVEKAIWLDSDMVVCHDLQKLWETDMNNQWLSAVQESYDTMTIGSGISYWKEINLPPDASYFNSGLMVLDLHRLRQEKFIPRALESLNQNKNRLRYYDQDILNIVCVNHWQKLDGRWNYIPWSAITIGSTDMPLESNHPYIVHYASALKPWHFSYGYSRRYGVYFYYMLALTEWKGWQPSIPLKEIMRKALMR